MLHFSQNILSLQQIGLPFSSSNTYNIHLNFFQIIFRNIIHLNLFVKLHLLYISFDLERLACLGLIWPTLVYKLMGKLKPMPGPTKPFLRWSDQKPTSNPANKYLQSNLSFAVLPPIRLVCITVYCLIFSDYETKGRWIGRGTELKLGRSWLDRWAT